MKTLILTRHGKTEQLSPESSKTDFERVLKPRGYKDSELVAGDLLNRHIQPDLLISSKAVRAQQTAYIFAGLLGINRHDIILEQFLYDGYIPGEFLNYLTRYSHRYESIMVVGHNPELAMTAISLTDNHDLYLPTAGTVAISFNVDNWNEINVREGTVEWLVTPKMFK